MIQIVLKTKDNEIESISISGHAMYCDYGKDIVCASASSIVISSINGILLFDKNSIDYKEGKTLVINNLKHDKVTNTLLANMINNLSELENNYPKNINIRKEEISWNSWN